MQTLTSVRNPALKEIRKAVARGGLTEHGFCVAEGLHLYEEARRSGREVEAVYVTETGLEKLGVVPNVILLPDPVFETIASTEASQGVITLVKPPAWTIADLFQPAPALVLALDGIQDPGNAGTCVRTAEAFGATGVAFLKGSVNPYHPKTLRAAAGSVFRVPLVAGLGEADLTAQDTPLFALMPQGSLSPADAPLGAGCVLIAGSEGRGVSLDLQTKAKHLRIPTIGVESLNAAIAAGIALYEAHKQRMRK